MSPTLPLLLFLIQPAQVGHAQAATPHAPLQGRIAEFEDAIDDVASKNLRRRLRKQLRLLLLDVDQQCTAPRPPLGFMPPMIVSPNTPPLGAVPHVEDEAYPQLQFPLADGDYRRLVEAVQHEDFPNDKLDVLDAAVLSSCLTTAQVGGLLKLFDHVSHRMKVSKSLVPRITDRRNAYRLQQVLTFRNEKKALTRLIRSGPVEARCAVP